jgi:flagellar hook-basal body complex protein FliE
MIQGLSAIDRTVSASTALQGFAPAPGAGQRIETTFAEALAAAGQKAVGSLEGAESASLRALQGDIDTREIVDSVMSAEQTLQAAIAIRDKIVTAYLDISRMAI